MIINITTIYSWSHADRANRAEWAASKGVLAAYRQSLMLPSGWHIRAIATYAS